VVAFVERAHVTFVGGRVPLLVLRGVAEAVALPELTLTEETAATCVGWLIRPQVIACEVEGPEQARFYIGALAGRHDVERQLEWLEAVRAAGGVVIVATDEIAPIRTLADLAGRAGLRGGFVCVEGSRPAPSRS
jgi:hypothetical protein